MTRLAFPLTLAAAATLAACAPASNTIAPSGVVTSGSGTVVTTGSGAVVGQPVIYAGTTPVAGQPLVPASASFKAGNGVIESIALVHIVPHGAAPVVPPIPSASSGATAGERLAYRLTVRMDDGSFQAVDQDNRNFFVGDRIAIVGEGRVTKQ